MNQRMQLSSKKVGRPMKKASIGGWSCLPGSLLPHSGKRLALEPLEKRQLLTTTLYVDFGDRFAGGVLASTVGALDSSSDSGSPNIDGPRLEDANNVDYPAGTAFRLTSFNTVFAASASSMRTTIMDMVRRAYEPFDVTVAELTSAFASINGFSARGASSLADISATLGLNEGVSENNDAYILVGQIAIGDANDDPINFQENGYGGIASGTDIGGSNITDGTALAFLRPTTSVQFIAETIAHEAGHLLGLRHTFGNDPAVPPNGSGINTLIHESDLMSYLSSETSAPNFFSRFPLVRGDGNTNNNTLSASPTPADQLLNDPNIGPSEVTFITGTGANDIVSIQRTGTNSASVSIQPFSDDEYSLPIVVPGAASTTFQYNISLDKPLLIDGGARQDRIILDASLPRNAVIRGGRGQDELQITGSGAEQATYLASRTEQNAGSITMGGGGVFSFSELETLSAAELASLTFTTANSEDVLFIDSPKAGQNRITGSSNEVGFAEVSFSKVANVVVDTGANDVARPNDSLRMSAAGLVADGLLSFAVNTGPGNDRVRLRSSPTATIQVNGGDPQSGDPGTPPGDVLIVEDPSGAAFHPVAPNGTVQIAGKAPINFTSIETLIAPDRFEVNNSIATATPLGSDAFVSLPNLSINNADDVDFFRIAAHETGKLVVRMQFQNSLGDLDLVVRDSSGRVLGASASSEENSEEITLPVIAQRDYFIHVSGFASAVNNYSLEIENFAAPLPSIVDLDPATDFGNSNIDYVTNVGTPRFVIQGDLLNFVDADQDGEVDPAEPQLLTAEQARAGNQGLAIELTATNIHTGESFSAFADPLRNGGAFSPLWQFSAANYPAGRTLANFNEQGVWHTSAAVVVFDGTGGRARTQLSVPVRVIADRVAPAAFTPVMSASSDTGAFNNDQVTSIRSPSFTGQGEVNSRVRLFANGRLVGEGMVGSDRSDAVFETGLGVWEVTVEPLADGVYTLLAQFEDAAGNIGPTSELLQVVIDATSPNIPHLDLLEASDSGRSNVDNITNINRPTVSSTIDDLFVIGSNPEPNDVRFRIYDRTGTGPEVLLVDSFASSSNTLTTQAFVTSILAGPGDAPLADGVHNLKLEVEDRAGNISTTTLQVIIDTVAPPVPTIGIDPRTSDTGVSGIPQTLSDRVTADTTTGFLGNAEADSIVQLFLSAGDLTPEVADDIAAGLTVAIPLDGNSAFTNGAWRLSATVDLNQLPFPQDGRRQAAATAEDVAGNVSEPGLLQMFVDTQGPRVTNISIDGQDAYDLFDPKPTRGPTPAVQRLNISMVDPGVRVTGFLYDALALNAAGDAVLGSEGEPSVDPGQYRLVGDHNGVIPIQRVRYVNTTPTAGELATGNIILDFFEPLPDDRFTLTILDGLRDPAGNALDGESNSLEPQEDPAFPSGDGLPGGAFQARFTVDSRPEIGVWGAGGVHIDTNGNFHFDPTNKDFVDRDLSYTIGFTSDDVFAGNFALEGNADGWDKIAAYGQVGGEFRFLIDVDHDGAFDARIPQPSGPHLNGLPVSGNFDGNAANGDEVGIFTGAVWNLDRNGDRFVLDTTIAADYSGLPVVGDFDGDLDDDLGVWSDDTFVLDLNADGAADVTFRFGFPGVRERPIAADFDLDGFDDLGLFVPDRSGPNPQGVGQWYILRTNGLPLSERLQASELGGSEIHFRPDPLGDDLFALFGDAFALPIVGNFDPPASKPLVANMPVHNVLEPNDVNRDGRVSPLDVLSLLDAMEDPVNVALRQSISFDTTGDGKLSPMDVLRIVDFLNQEAEMVGVSKSRASAADSPASASVVDARVVDAIVVGTAFLSMKETNAVVVKRK